MTNEEFRSLWNLFDALVIPGLHWPLTQVSAAINHATGIWFHPSTWESVVILFALGAGFIYCRSRRTKAAASFGR
jgi:hypothetical protein